MILFVGSYLKSQQKAVEKLEKILKRELTACVIVDDSDMAARAAASTANKAVVIECDFSKETEIQKALLPYKNRFLAVTCRAERNIPLLKKVVPHVPYLNTPTEKSLDWTTDKIKMRQLLRGYDRSISVSYTHLTLPTNREV
mgnify:FL=1